MKTTVMLDEAIELEERLSTCYELLSQTAKDGLSGELKALAREEKSHVSVLKTGKNFVFQAPDAFGPATISDAEIQIGIKAVSDLQADLKAARLDLAGGLKRLSNLEKKFEKVHMNRAVEFNDFSLRKLFEALARADAEHRQRLDRLLARI